MHILKLQLRSFGLNPSQWLLRRAQNQILVVHRKDPNLKFIGTYVLNSVSRLPQWDQLVLVD